MSISSLSRTDRVQAAIALCDAWYAAKNYDIYTLTERINALWLEVKHLLSLMKAAEAENDEVAVKHYLERILYHVIRIHGECNAFSH